MKTVWGYEKPTLDFEVEIAYDHGKFRGPFPCSVMSISEHDSPRFSKKAINRAGDTLIDPQASEEQKEAALELLDYWRSIHAIPLERLLDHTRPFAQAFFSFHDEGCANMIPKIIHHSTRLKRTESIVKKLKRYPEMKLTRMQDIAGVRNVCLFSEHTVSFCSSFVSVVDRISESFATRHPCKRKFDYITEPKSSGYRAVHFVHEFQGFEEPEYNGLQFEIQYRTKLQHVWAMAVETVGMFYGEALKSSQGNQAWQDFFVLASAAFSHLEEFPVVAVHAEKTFEEIRGELRHEAKEKSFSTKLQAIREIDRRLSGEEYDYWLLEVNIKKGTNHVYGFKTEQLQTALEMYTAKEQTPACLRGESQVVLVSTESINDLRNAYPSFFLDVTEFIDLLENLFAM